ncbi:MAG: hypothetical protein ABIA47_01380 [bacterium]
MNQELGYKKIQSEVRPVAPIEQEYPEWLNLKRPPNASVKEYAEAFFKMADEIILEINKYKTDPQEFVSSLSDKEIEYLKAKQLLRTIQDDRVFAKVLGRERKRIGDLKNEIISQAAEQEAMIERHKETIANLLDALNRELRDIDDYEPVKLENIQLIIEPMKSRHGTFTGGKMSDNGIIRLNSLYFKKHPDALSHDFLHEAIHFASARYVDEEKAESKRAGFRYKDKTGYKNFDFFNEAMVEKKALELCESEDVNSGDPTYQIELRALKNVVNGMNKYGFDADKLLNEAFFGKGSVLGLVRAVDRVYAEKGGFSVLRELLSEHQEALRSGNFDEIDQKAGVIEKWCLI